MDSVQAALAQVATYAVIFIKMVFFDWVEQLVSLFILYGPNFMGYGGHLGKDKVDICASRDGHSATFWIDPKNFPECVKSIDALIWGNSFFWCLIFWFYILVCHVLPNTRHILAFLLNPIKWLFTPVALTSTPAPPTTITASSPGSPTKPKTAAQAAGAAKAANTRRTNAEKLKAYDVLVPFVRSLLLWDRDKSIGEFLSLTPCPMDRNLLALPPIPTDIPLD